MSKVDRYLSLKLSRLKAVALISILLARLSIQCFVVALKIDDGFHDKDDRDNNSDQYYFDLHSTKLQIKHYKNHAGTVMAKQFVIPSSKRNEPGSSTRTRIQEGKKKRLIAFDLDPILPPYTNVRDKLQLVLGEDINIDAEVSDEEVDIDILHATMDSESTQGQESQEQNSENVTVESKEDNLSNEDLMKAEDVSTNEQIHDRFEVFESSFDQVDEAQFIDEGTKIQEEATGIKMAESHKMRTNDVDNYSSYQIAAVNEENLDVPDSKVDSNENEQTSINADNTQIQVYDEVEENKELSDTEDTGDVNLAIKSNVEQEDMHKEEFIDSDSDIKIDEISAQQGRHISETLNVTNQPDLPVQNDINRDDEFSSIDTTEVVVVENVISESTNDTDDTDLESARVEGSFQSLTESIETNSSDSIETGTNEVIQESHDSNDEELEIDPLAVHADSIFVEDESKSVQTTEGNHEYEGSQNYEDEKDYIQKGETDLNERNDDNDDQSYQESPNNESANYNEHSNVTEDQDIVINTSDKEIDGEYFKNYIQIDGYEKGGVTFQNLAIEVDEDVSNDQIHIDEKDDIIVPDSTIKVDEDGSSKEKQTGNIQQADILSSRNNINDSSVTHGLKSIEEEFFNESGITTSANLIENNIKNEGINDDDNMKIDNLTSPPIENKSATSASQNNNMSNDNSLILDQIRIVNTTGESEINTNANHDFVSGLDDIHKFFEDVDPPDELDPGAGGLSLEEVIKSQGIQIIKTRLNKGIKFIKGIITKIRQRFNDEGDDSSIGPRINEKIEVMKDFAVEWLEKIVDFKETCVENVREIIENISTRFSREDDEFEYLYDEDGTEDDELLRQLNA